MQSTSMPAPQTRSSVLVVDDDALIRRQLVLLLELAGYQVQSAGSGAQALLMLSFQPYEIVLTDWEMPNMDGPSLCRALRLRAGGRNTYMMILSVRGHEADMLIGLAAGADDYLVKGAPAEELLERIAVGRRTATPDPAIALQPGQAGFSWTHT